MYQTADKSVVCSTWHLSGFPWKRYARFTFTVPSIHIHWSDSTVSSNTTTYVIFLMAQIFLLGFL